MNTYLSAINRLKYGTTDFFNVIEFQTFTVCNRKCSFCPIAATPLPPKFMSMKLIEKLVMELKEINYSGWFSPHLYGEPLLDKRLGEIFKLARLHIPRAYNVIYSNGDLLTYRKFKELRAAGCDLFIVSQYDNEMHPTIKELYKHMSPLEKTHVSYRIINDDTPLSTRAGLVEPTKLATDFDCPVTTVFIDVHGKVVLCSNDYNSTSVLGDFNTETLVDIWNSDRYVQIRKELKKGIYSETLCKNCKGEFAHKSSPTSPAIPPTQSSSSLSPTMGISADTAEIAPIVTTHSLVE